MQSVYTILLLIVSNIFMTCAWYGHLKMKQQFDYVGGIRGLQYHRF